MASLLDKLLHFDEPFGNTSGRKEKLTEIASNYKAALEEKLDDLQIDSKRLGKQALVIGGSITAAYLLLQLILPDEEPDYRTKNGDQPIIIERKNESSWIGKTVQSVVVTALLALARERLVAFLEAQNQTDADENPSSDTE